MVTRNPLATLKRIDRWQICLIILGVVYGAVLATNLQTNSMAWDEVAHLNGGLLLSRGQVVTWALTNSFYPPIYDLFAAGYFLVLGPSLFSARLVAATFSVLTLFVIYAIANFLYSNKKTAFLAAIFFAVMPGIFWLSKLAMIETMLIFVLSLSMFYFFRWLKLGNGKDRTKSLAAVVVGVVVKYQMLVIAPLIMIFGTFFWRKENFWADFKKWFAPKRLALMVTVLAVVGVVLLVLYSLGLLDLMLYAFGVGSQGKSVYSTRYPLPIFYLLEMVQVENPIHPISLVLYVLSLAGLGWMVYKRKFGDKLLLLWFAVVYVVFTVVSNREWRYVVILFPVLAIAASNLTITALEKLCKTWQTAVGFMSKYGTKIAAGLLIAFVGAGLCFSCVDAYNWQIRDEIVVPIEQATLYAAQDLGPNQTVAVVCSVNHFSKYMVQFYLDVQTGRNLNQTWQYPFNAADSFTPNFDVVELTGICQRLDTKYVMLYEYGNLNYYNTELNQQTIQNLLTQSNYFTLAETFGESSNRVFVFRFNQSD
ncbi:MAG: glycosyltransferase family 39 protein [Candidatus Bathyarchaeota archaeon]|nr:glycosyltransferase family 39 protein [Candidatus Bathyarchaeota archaeon]